MRHYNSAVCIASVTIHPIVTLASAVIAVALAFIFLQLPGNSLFWQAVQNSGHAIIFTALSSFVLLTLLRWQQRLVYTTVAITSVSLFVLGLCIELAQHLTGRGASIEDLALNAAGIFTGCCLYLTAYAIKSKSPRTLKTSLIVVLGTIAMLWSLKWPVIYAATGTLRTALPILASFEHPGAQLYLTGKGESHTVSRHAVWQNNSSRSLQVQFQPGRWPNIQFLEPEQDWSDYSNLTFKTYNPAPHTLTVYVRIDDRTLGLLDEDHMTVRHEIRPGINDVVLPFSDFRDDATRRNLSGKPTFTDIASFLVYLSKPESDTVLYFDDFTLQ